MATDIRAVVHRMTRKILWIIACCWAVNMGGQARIFAQGGGAGCADNIDFVDQICQIAGGTSTCVGHGSLGNPAPCCFQTPENKCCQQTCEEWQCRDSQTSQNCGVVWITSNSILLTNFTCSGGDCVS